MAYALLRLTVRSKVKPKCGNNLSESLHVFLCCSEFRLSSFIGSVLVDGPSCVLLHLSYVIDSVQATVVYLP